MANFDAIRTLTGNTLDGFTVFASGSTPGSVAAMIEEHIFELEAGSVAGFTSVVLLSAVAQKRLIDEFISKPENFAVMNFIRNRFYIQNHINFSALNLAGHCIMAGAGVTNVPLITAFRAKLGADSIWESDLVRASISDDQRRIFQEKARKFGVAEARDSGIRIIEALRRRHNHAIATGGVTFPISTPVLPFAPIRPGISIGGTFNAPRAEVGQSSVRPMFTPVIPPSIPLPVPPMTAPMFTTARPIMATAMTTNPITASVPVPPLAAVTAAATTVATSSAASLRRSTRNNPGAAVSSSADTDSDPVADAPAGRGRGRSSAKRTRT